MEVKIGIDKITLKNIMCQKVDLELLTSKMRSNSGVVDCQNNDYYIINDQDFYLEVRTYWFDGIKSYSATLTPKRADNVEPLRIAELDEMIMRIKDKLWTEYNIELILADAVIKDMEINATIPIDHDYKDYEYLLNYGCALYVRHLREDYNGRNNIPRCYPDNGTIYVKTSETDVKCYDKRAEMLSKLEIDIDYNLLRVEYRLNNSKSVGKRFNGGKNVRYLDFIHYKTDDYIAQWLKTRLYKDIWSRLINRYYEQLETVSEAFRRLKSDNNYSLATIQDYEGAMSHTNDITDKLLDTEIIVSACRKVDRNYKRTLKKMHGEKWHCTGTMERLDELIQKLNYSVCVKNEKNKKRKYPRKIEDISEK